MRLHSPIGGYSPPVPLWGRNGVCPAATTAVHMCTVCRQRINVCVWWSVRVCARGRAPPPRTLVRDFGCGKARCGHARRLRPSRPRAAPTCLRREGALVHCLLAVLLRYVYIQPPHQHLFTRATVRDCPSAAPTAACAPPHRAAVRGRAPMPPPRRPHREKDKATQQNLRVISVSVHPSSSLHAHLLHLALLEHLVHRVIRHRKTHVHEQRRQRGACKPFPGEAMKGSCFLACTSSLQKGTPRVPPCTIVRASVNAAPSVASLVAAPSRGVIRHLQQQLVRAEVAPGAAVLVGRERHCGVVVCT